MIRNLLVLSNYYILTINTRQQHHVQQTTPTVSGATTYKVGKTKVT